MSIIDCFVNHGRPDLQKKFNEQVKGGKSEYDAARDILMDEHKNLHDKTNGIRKELKIPITEYKNEAPPPTNTEVPEGTGEGGNKVGVSHASLTELGKKLGFKEPERGEYLPPEWYADRGRKLIAAGANPDEVNNPNNELHDRISIARAHLEDLTKEADNIAKNNPDGIESDEYKKYAQKASDYALNTVKKLGTLGHRAFESLQGERDVDTDSFTNVKQSVKDKIGGVTKEQESKIKSLTDENQRLKKQVEESEAKLIEQTDKELGKPPKEEKDKSIKTKAKETADRLRKAAKIHKPGSFSAATPASLAWDASVEIVAKSIEAGGNIADAIAKGLEYVKNTDWYKGLSKDKQKEAEDDFTNFHNENAAPIDGTIESLWKRFTNKTDNDFTRDESKAIWDYAKKNYIDKGISYRDMISNVANDTGLSYRQVTAAITPKYNKHLVSNSDAMWKKQQDYRRNQISTQNWVDSQDKSKAGTILSKVSGVFRGVSVFGHGGIFVGTHAAPTLFKPTHWKYTIPAFFRGWKYAYGNEGKYARSMEELKNRPNYVLAQRAGLQNNPERINSEEYQKSQKFLGKLGLAGERGFNAIKVLRQDLFDAHYNRLSDAAKADPQTAENISHLVNNATGATNLKLPKWVNEVSFAGGMEAARWEKLTSNPLKAASTAIKAIVTPNKVPVSDRVFAKIYAKRVGEQLATFTGLLLANAAIQNSLSPNNKVNYTDPTKPDFMKFKFGDVTIDPSSGMRGAMLFAYGLGKIPFMDKKQLKGDTRMQALGKNMATYGRGKLAPFYSTIADFYTQQDFDKNPLPFSNDKPTAGHHKLTWGEYAWQKAPLPVAEAAKVVYKSAEENGSDKPALNNYLNGIMSGAISGSTGFRVGEYNAEKENLKHSPFTEQDKKDPTFKYFYDRGLEMPNTVHSSETVPHSKGKKISEYPKETQDKYDDVHKELLKKELSEVVKKGYVYVNSDDNVASTGKKVKFDDLTDDQKHQVLHRAQSGATKKAKEKVFKK